MSLAIDLAAMTGAEKEALAETAMLKARIGDLTRPPKTPDNSSVPPSKSAKPGRSVQ